MLRWRMSLDARVEVKAEWVVCLASVGGFWLKRVEMARASMPASFRGGSLAVVVVEPGFARMETVGEVIVVGEGPVGRRRWRVRRLGAWLMALERKSDFWEWVRAGKGKARAGWEGMKMMWDLLVRWFVNGARISLERCSDRDCSFSVRCGDGSADTSCM